MKLPYIVIMAAALFANTTLARAQRHEILNDRIQSLQVIADDDAMTLPIIELGRGHIDIDFDDMTHEYRRYAYRIDHCEADWKKSEQIFESDYVNGFANGNTIDDVEESVLTNTLYTHYHLRLPNDRCQMKMSGNYRLTVYDDNNEEKPVFTACFMVVEPRHRQMGVGLSVTTNTDIDINNRHQQVSMQLNYGNNYRVTDHSQQLKTVVIQNNRWDDARWNAKPQYVNLDGLAWDHNRNLIFEAGNEFRKFEILSTDVASMGVNHIEWDGSQFHAHLFMDEPRPNYLYDEDANGAFILRNSDNINITNESDYMMVHFHLKTPRIDNGEIYLSGAWTNDRLLPRYCMKYDEETQTYETVVLLKLGYYSYQYLLATNDGRIINLPTEGNYYQTENQYRALVYYREPGGRTDRLVGYQDKTFIAR